MVDINFNQLQQWLGKETIAEAVISAEPANLMAATLDQEIRFETGDPLPPGWHWLYFHEPVKTLALGVEGHTTLGGFMPPVPLPRRMWAGGSLTFAGALHIGDYAIKRSVIQSITPKSGRSGQLCFVVVSHEISVEGDACINEEQTIVYREAARSGQPQIQARPASVDAQFSATYTPNPVLLFRYSALTFNSHRIHYDLDYCRNQEGYPDLVVHGPLTATLLLDLFYNQFPSEPIKTFEYRGLSPLFNPHPFTVNGTRQGSSGRAWAANQEGGLAMEATVGF
jgi:3-methylfumaryl-CoA hydratase